MKFVGIAGSISEKSYNRKLLHFVKYLFVDEIEIEILDIKGVPLFNQDLKEEDYPKIKEINDKILEADGVIFVTPEHNRTVPGILKSLLECLSYNFHPLKSKPVMILGASRTDLGTSSAQLHLRQILNAPGAEAFVMPGNEFLLSKADTRFDEDGKITDEITVDYLEHVMHRFVKFAELMNQVDINSIETKYTMTMAAGGYVNLDDPEADGTAGASEY